jgi:hypothetical protein
LSAEPPPEEIPPPDHTPLPESELLELEPSEVDLLVVVVASAL